MCDAASGIKDGASSIGDVARDAAQTTWDRGSTHAVYEWDVANRLVRHPRSANFDPFTVGLEQVTAAVEVWQSDAELKRDGRFCGSHTAECFIGGNTLGDAGGTTFGHSVVFKAKDGRTEVSEQLVAHEFQHVADIDSIGGSAFYSTYAANAVVAAPLCFVKGCGKQQGNFWEYRAYGFGDNYDPEHPTSPNGVTRDLAGLVGRASTRAADSAWNVLKTLNKWQSTGG